MKYGSDGLKIAGLPKNAIPEPPPELIQTDGFPFYAADESRIVFVKSNYLPRADGGDVVAFTEFNEAHPNGEVFIAGKMPKKVALTERVARALNDGLLIEADESEVGAVIKQRRRESRKSIEAKREIYFARYVELIGYDDGNFEKAWNSIKSRLALESIAADLGE